MSKMRLNAVVLVAAFLAAGCTSRVVYRQNEFAPAPQAIDINRAGPDELTSVPHIGPETARAIVAFREANGPFRRVEEIMLVRGVSEAKFLDMRPLIAVR